MGSAPSAPIASSIRVSTSPQTFRVQKSKRSGRRSRRPASAPSPARAEARLEREALERVVRRARPVEVAAEPAGAQLLARRAHLPEVARGEVRLVWAFVADAGRSDTCLAVQRGERRERGMPAETAVLGEGRAVRLGERQPRSQLPVQRVGGGEEHRERVGAAVEEDADEHALRPGRGCRRDPLLERARYERRAAVDGEREAGAAGEERAPVEPRSGGQRHAGFDRGQAPARPRLRRGAATRRG